MKHHIYPDGGFWLRAFSTRPSVEELDESYIINDGHIVQASYKISKLKLL